MLNKLAGRIPNPLRGVDNPRQVFAWGMYDLANQSFTLLIITLLFSRYVQQVVTIHPPTPPSLAQLDTTEPASGDRAAAALDRADLTAAQRDEIAAYIDERERADRRGELHWSLMHGGTLLLVVAISPVVGAFADARGRRKRLLISSGLLCAALTASLAFVGPGMLLLAALLYVPANLCFQIGENFLASFLPQVSTPRTIGRISAIGWTMGYIGALALLAISAVIIVVGGLGTEADWPPLFVFAGVWFALGLTPAALVLPRDEPSPDLAERVERSGALRQGFERVAETLRHARRYRELMKFLVAFLIYGFGVQVIIAFASILAGDFGFERLDLIVFVAQITVTAGVAAWVTGLFQDRIGVRATIQIYLAIWLASAGGLLTISVMYPAGGPQWPLWVIGNGLGFGLGGIGTASRSMVARFTPRHRRAEFFGLWGMAYKLAGALGVLGFGVLAELFGRTASLVFLTSTFAAGMLLMLPVREIAGVRAARRVERALAANEPRP